jgi:Tol biopolymer transport system component
VSAPPAPWGAPLVASSDAYFSSISDDGTRVVFRSSAEDLEPVTTGPGPDVFLYDVPTGIMHVLSNAPGVPANGTASYPQLSADGQRVVFNSNADNLVPGDVNGQADVFLAELGQPLRLISRNLAGLPASGGSSRATISADGRLVAFLSDATDLIAVDGNGSSRDAFVVDVDTGAVELASISSFGLQAFQDAKVPVITRDGRSVAFESDAEYAPYGSTANDRSCGTSTPRRSTRSRGRAAWRWRPTRAAGTWRCRRTARSWPSTASPPAWSRATPTA